MSAIRIFRMCFIFGRANTTTGKSRAEEYEIRSFDENRVMLYDFQIPLFNKEFIREEFDRRVRETR